MIEEHKRADHPRLRRRERAADGESVTKVGGAWHHQGFDGIALEFVAGGRVFSGEETHRLLLRCIALTWLDYASRWAFNLDAF
jgi:hypothetical protein